MARKVQKNPPIESVIFGDIELTRAEAEDFLQQFASQTGAAAQSAYNKLNQQLTVDPDTGLQLDQETYDEAIKLWSPDSGVDGFYEGTYGHRLTPEMVRKAKNTVTARREQQGVATKEKEVLDSYLKLIKESPNANRGQTLLTSGRAGSNSILGSPIDPMKTVLT